MKSGLHHLLTYQRKVAVTGVTGLALIFGFLVVVAHPPALEAYKVLAEWLVFLCASYCGFNSVTYFSKKGPQATDGKEATKANADGNPPA